jgi:hypothetical protein
MEESLAELERVQTHLLQRISKLEQHSNLPSHTNPNPPLNNNPQIHTDTVSRLSSILQTNGVSDFSFKRVASDYYDWPLEARRDALKAASIHHLCKSIVLVNTQAPSNVVDCSDRNNSKYYVVVVQVLCFLFFMFFLFILLWLNYAYNVVICFSFFCTLQYTARFNADAVKNFLYSLNNGTIAKKKFNCKLLCFARAI